jgi:Uma2 family endonuclease
MIAADLPARPLTLADVTRLAEADSRHRYGKSRHRAARYVAPPADQRAALRLVHDPRIRGRVNIPPSVRTAADDLNGRIPDLVVTTGPIPDDTVWLAPESVALAVEIVSKGSERIDRWLKPVEYAEAGIPHFWRVEPDDTVVRFRLEGNRHVESGSLLLESLLAGDVPDKL